MGWADMFKQPVTQQPGDGSAAPVGPGIQAPADAPPGTPPATTAPGGQNIQQLVQQFLQGKPSGEATLQALKQHLAGMGIQIEIPTRAGGSQSSQDKIVLPDRSVIDLWGDEGGAMTPQWSQDGYWVNGQPSSRPDMVYQQPEGFSLQGANGLASFGAPGLLAPYTQEFQDRFQMPTPENMLASPSYQWNLSRGLDAYDKSHAAQGTYNTGGRTKDAMEFASGLASAEYDKNFDRGLRLRDSDMNLYGMNRGTFWGNQDNTFNKQFATAGLGARSASDYANNVSSIYENMANANASEQGVRGSNTGNLVGGGINTGLGALFDWLGNRGKG